jgi:hypothetical protein
MAFRGYGLPYHLVQAHDPIRWLTFFIGDVNFVAAAVAVAYLLRRRGFYLHSPSRLGVTTIQL